MPIGFGCDDESDFVSNYPDEVYVLMETDPMASTFSSGIYYPCGFTYYKDEAIKWVKKASTEVDRKWQILERIIND